MMDSKNLLLNIFLKNLKISYLSTVLMSLPPSSCSSSSSYGPPTQISGFLFFNYS